jgi:hypothetical protein
MSGAPKPYNILATFGQLSVGLQGLSSALLAGMLVLAGGAMMATHTVPCVAKVTEVDCSYNMCAVAVEHSLNGYRMQSSFTTPNTHAYSPGDVIKVQRSVHDPTKISEDLPWGTMGASMVIAAIALATFAWYMVNVVSDSRNMAALAGTFTFLRFLVA